MKNVVTFAHNILKESISVNSLVIDATVGNGHDTVFLAKHAKHVIGFDLQEQAIEHTKDLLAQHKIENVTLFCASHDQVKDYVKDPVDGAIFNLGYLPNSDKSLTTKGPTTIRAIKQILTLLNPSGIICITIYVGHEQGKQEQKLLEEYFQTLDSKTYTVVRYQHVNRPSAPYTVCIQKR
jgi:methylase of polypeptide subunit release factors